MHTLRNSVLSTADVARLFNVTETTVKRWADEGTLRCRKTPGGHRKYEIRSVVEFAEENNLEPAGALEITGEDSLASTIRGAVLERDFPVLVSAYVSKALSARGGELLPFLSYLYQHRVQLWEIHDRVISPAMREIGDRWARAEIGVCHEHRASCETLESLARLQLQIRIKPASGHSVVCAALGEELHEIGLRCAAYLFESEGWDSRYLGPRTPAQAVEAAIAQWRPQVVCLSTTQGVPEDALVHLAPVVKAASGIGASVLAGGPLAPSFSGYAGVVEAGCNSMEKLLCFIAGYGRARQSPDGEHPLPA